MFAITLQRAGNLACVGDAVDLSRDLRERVRLLTAKVMFNEAVGRDLVALACDLLAAGVETPTTVALAAEPFSITMSDAEPLFRDAIEELGLPPLPKDQAGWLLARSVARQMEADSIPQHIGARILWGLWWDLGNPGEIGALAQLLDEWEEKLPHERAPIEAEIRAHVPAVIAAADRALA